MIYIKINRYTIIKLEEALEKYNSENPYSADTYEEIINRLLEKFLAEKKKVKKS